MEKEFKNQNILGRDLVDEMEESYLSYAMSVITVSYTHLRAHETLR